jgi:hypothetical protein
LVDVIEMRDDDAGIRRFCHLITRRPCEFSSDPVR